MCDCADLRERLDQLETRMIHIEAEVDDIQDGIEIRRRPPQGDGNASRPLTPCRSPSMPRKRPGTRQRAKQRRREEEQPDAS